MPLFLYIICNCDVLLWCDSALPSHIKTILSEANGQIIKQPSTAEEGVCVRNGIIIDKEDLPAALKESN